MKNSCRRSKETYWPVPNEQNHMINPHHPYLHHTHTTSHLIPHNNHQLSSHGFFPFCLPASPFLKHHIFFFFGIYNNPETYLTFSRYFFWWYCHRFFHFRGATLWKTQTRYLWTWICEFVFLSVFLFQWFFRNQLWRYKKNLIFSYLTIWNLSSRSSYYYSHYFFDP